MPRLAAPIAAAVLAVALAGVPAVARDSDAPPGASHRWLPCEDWVMYHWLPYDERALLRALRIDRDGLRRWLRNDREHAIEQLVRRRGFDPAELADRLVAAWAPDASGAWGDELRDRAMGTLRDFAGLGVRLGATPRPQADRFLREQRRGLSWWLDARISKPDARRTSPVYRERTIRPRRELVCFLFAGRRSG